jgi:hypothetical protein
MIEAEVRKIIHLHLVSIFIYSFVPTQTIENVLEVCHAHSILRAKEHLTSPSVYSRCRVISLVVDALSHVPSLLECTCFCADIVAKIDKDEA